MRCASSNTWSMQADVWRSRRSMRRKGKRGETRNFLFILYIFFFFFIFLFFQTARDAVKLSLDRKFMSPSKSTGSWNFARKQNDYITINFLQWFLTEQLEEVSSMDNLLKIIERAGTDLLQADEYLARVGLRTMPEPPKHKPVSD